MLPDTLQEIADPQLVIDDLTGGGGLFGGNDISQANSLEIKILCWVNTSIIDLDKYIR